jgi:hypothetical protein
MTEAKKRGRPRKFEERPHFATALEYAMHVINDHTVTARRRDTLAMAVLRYGYQSQTGKPTIDKPAGKKVEADRTAITAHQETEWGELVQ